MRSSVDLLLRIRQAGLEVPNLERAVDSMRRSGLLDRRCREKLYDMVTRMDVQTSGRILGKLADQSSLSALLPYLEIPKGKVR